MSKDCSCALAGFPGSCSNCDAPSGPIKFWREQYEATLGDLTKLAAECHRSKWQFTLEGQPNASEARRLVAIAFNELHRIGDMAMKLRDQPDT